MPTISVIVPVYNVEKYLKLCIDSIMSQTFTDFELILVDDGSTDNSSIICDEYAKIDGRIVVVHQNNAGVSNARNRGLDIATGEFVVFVDSDDTIEHDYLELVTQYHNFDIIVSGIITQRFDGTILKEEKYQYNEYLTQDSIDYLHLYTNTMMHSGAGKFYRRNIIKKHNIRFVDTISWGEDTMFVLDCVTNAASLIVLDKTGYHYISYNDQTLSQKIRADYIESITTSREYCVQLISKIRPEISSIIKEYYTNTIYWLYIDALKRILTSNSLKFKEQLNLLKIYSRDKYIQEICRNPFKLLHPKDPLAIALSAQKPIKILIIFKYHKIKNSILVFIQKIIS